MTPVSVGYSLLSIVLFFFALTWWGCSLYNKQEKLYCNYVATYTGSWALGVLLISLRGLIPDWASFTLSNFIIIAGFVFLVLSVEEQFELPSSVWPLIVLLVLSGLLLLVFGADGIDHSKRLIVLGTSSALCCIIAMRRGLRPLFQEHGYKVTWFVGGIGVAATALWVLRVKFSQEMNPDELNLISDSSFNLYALYLIWLTAICFQGSMLFLLIARNARKLEVISTLDFLTGAHNRLGLAKIWEIVGQRHQSVSVLVLDIDHFKSINDQFGHDVGDSVLKLVVARAKAVIRLEDRLARLGGEEFVVLLPDMSVDDAYNFAQRLRRAIDDDPFRLDNLEINVSISIGVSGEAQITNQTDIYKLIKEADDALYMAKEQGRNRVIFNPGTNALNDG